MEENKHRMRIMMATEKSKSMIKTFWSSSACLVLLVLSALVDVGVCQTGGGVSSIVSSDVFNSIVGGAASGCAGKGFYTYDSFINAANAFNAFGTSGPSDVNKREIAAFFANAAYETGGSSCPLQDLINFNLVFYLF